MCHLARPESRVPCPTPTIFRAVPHITQRVLVSSDATTPVILSACRTPIGKYLGAISSLSAPRLGAIAIKEAVRRAGIDPQLIDDVIMGHVVQGGSGQAPGRQAMIHAGLPATIPALTINKVCGSGLKAVMLAAQSIKAGDAQCVVAGGMESMSSAPHYLYNYRNGIKAGNQTIVDGMIHDGLWDSFGNNHMGEYAEYTAEKAKVSRQDQDAYAAESHRRAIAAQAAGKFNGEMVGVEIASRSGTTTVSADESPRADTSAETLAKLKPVFRKDGTVTAGNAPGLNDGGAATVVASLAFAKAHGLVPMARIAAYATGGGEPKELFFAPILAVQNLMQKAGTKIGDYDLIEANEAFAVQAIADGRGLGWDTARVNVNGGAIALGHPIGASGARVLATLLYAMQDRKARTGLATLCLGGGNAVALSVETL
jgi:acetyl-CoA C-acetyltransferase